MTEKLYVATQKYLDSNNELEVISSYGRSFSATWECVAGDADIYELVKVPEVVSSAEQVSSGVWMVYTDSGTLAFKTELEAYRYAFGEMDDRSVIVELKTYTEGY